MTRTMWDSVNPDAIPATAGMVAGYVDGRYANLAQMRARFPRAIVVDIATSPSIDATVLDCETGDALPTQCPAWAVRQRARGAVPVVYCNGSTWPAVRAAFDAAGVAQPLYGIADYDGVPVIPDGALYKQYAGNVPPNYDLNVVADYWPGVDPAPIPIGILDMELTDKIAPGDSPYGQALTVGQLLGIMAYYTQHGNTVESQQLNQIDQDIKTSHTP